MAIEVVAQLVKPRKLAAVRRRVPPGGAGAAWKPALDLVWAFLRDRPALRTDGHNVFLYRHPDTRGAPLEVDFGVEVVQSFPPAGEVRETETPGGEAAIAVHRGGYDRLPAAHDAIHHWAKAQGRSFAGWSWEIYGDWSDDPAQMETAVVYLLA